MEKMEREAFAAKYGMTDKELVTATYTFGRIHGMRAALLADKTERKKEFPDSYFDEFGRSPMSGMVKGSRYLMDNHIDTAPIEDSIGRLAATIPPQYPESVPIELTGSWQLGYYRGLDDYGKKGSGDADSGDWIAQARSRLGWSQARLAQEMGVTQPHVSGWESGKTVPNKATEARLRGVLGV